MKTDELITATPFDRAAENYDREFTSSPIGLFQRKRVHHFLEKILDGSSSLKILEINCGTGEDAIWLARKGHEVMATDASAGMIDAAVKKCTREQKKLNIAFQAIPFGNLLNELQGNRYDIVFSDFGGLNCIDQEEMKKLAGDIRKLLRPGGKFVAVIMGRKCIWETGYFMVKGKWKQAFRRLGKHAVTASVGSAFQHTWYFSPSEVNKFFGKDMVRVMIKPIGFALPPSYLGKFFNSRSTLLSMLNSMERGSGFSFLADFSDHYFIVLEKKNNNQEI